jgi:hypothetical protein
MAMIPPVGTSGVYTLSGPFTTKLRANTSYRCEAVRRVADLLEMGVDPFEEFYEPIGLSRATYDMDLANMVSIVSLASESNHWLYVPSSYITGYPNINGISYTALILGVQLGAVPNYMDLSGLHAAIKEIVQDTIGVIPNIQTVGVSAAQMLSQTDHDAVEAARQYKITNTQTSRAKVIALTRENASLRQKLQSLEAYVAALP